MLLRKLKVNKLTILFIFILSLIFLQVLLIAPEEIGSTDTQLTKNKIEKMAQQQGSQKAIEQKMKGVHLVENANNQKGWELQADEATGSSDEQWILKKVRVEFFSEDLSSFVVVGQVGEVNGQTKNMIIRGEVTTTSSNGYQFVTNDLYYDAAEKKLKSLDQVKMLGPDEVNGTGFELTGTGFTADIVKDTMRIENNVVAEKVIDNKNVRIKSDSAEFSNKNQEAGFFGQVYMNYDKSVLTAPEAYFKYSSTLKAVEFVTLKDKVTLKEDNKSATCRLLQMNIPKNTMTLSGQPKVQMGEDEIQGEEIIFLDGGKKVRMNKVTIKGQKINDI